MSDFVTAAVIHEGFASVVREMRGVMVRSSYSSIIYEGYDFSCVVIDPSGQLVAQSGEDHPFHIIPVAWSVRNLLSKHANITNDDIFLHNDPYTGGTHLNDIAVVYPLFHEGCLRFFIVVRSHWADVGGITPGSLSGRAEEILHEGLRLSNLRIPKNGHSEVLRLIFDNVRVSDEAMADFNVVLGTCRVAERRLKALLNKYGCETVQSAVAATLDSSERRMCACIRELPEGTYRFISYLDGNAAETFPLRVQVALTIADSKIHADFTGTVEQVRAPLNAGPAIAPTSVMTVVKSFLDPAGVLNSGSLRPLTVTVPPRTILSAVYPAPCGGLNEVRFAADAAVMGALAKVIPDRMTGDVRGTSNHTYIGGWDRKRDKPFIFYEYPSGGTGGSANADGNHAVRAFNEGENVSIQSSEVIEQIYPLRIVQNELRPDSGGPGRTRGGCGLIRKVEVLCDGAKFSLLSDRNLIPPFGVNGGRSGAPNRYDVLRDGVAVDQGGFPGKVSNMPLRSGDVVVMMSSGGGGYGRPSERALDCLQSDLDEGLVSENCLAAYNADLVNGKVVRGQGANDEYAVHLAWDRPAAAPPHLCVIGEVLAAKLAVACGQLVELVFAEGPPLRLWVADIQGDGTTLSVAPALRSVISSVPVSLRALPSFAPATREQA
jgi:N-methylhydantoinase B